MFAHFPHLVQATFGTCGVPMYLVGALATVGISKDHILQRRTDGFIVSVPLRGIDYHLTHINESVAESSPTTLPEEPLWAVGAVTIYPDRWDGPLPAGLPRDADAAHIRKHFQVDPMQSMQLASMLCFTVTDKDRAYAVMCFFDSDEHKLESVTIKHQGDWIWASALPPWPDSTVTPDMLW